METELHVVGDGAWPGVRGSRIRASWGNGLSEQYQRTQSDAAIRSAGRESLLPVRLHRRPRSDDADVLEVLEGSWSGVASWKLEQLLMDSDIPVTLFTSGG